MIFKIILGILRYETRVSCGYTYSRMKKHRNFLIFYSLWLGAIVALLMVFDTPEEQAMTIEHKGHTVCELNTRAVQHTEPTKAVDKWYCDSKRPDSATRLQ